MQKADFFGKDTGISLKLPGAKSPKLRFVENASFKMASGTIYLLKKHTDQMFSLPPYWILLL